MIAHNLSLARSELAENEVFVDLRKGTQKTQNKNERKFETV